MPLSEVIAPVMLPDINFSTNSFNGISFPSIFNFIVKTCSPRQLRGKSKIKKFYAGSIMSKQTFIVNRIQLTE